jgi:transketolase
MTKKNKKQKGLNRNMHLARNILNTEKIKYTPTRNGYGEGVVEAGKNNSKIMVLCADLTESTRSLEFKNYFPDRFVQMGVSEQSMASIAAGMSLTGKVPFISSYAAFSPGRNWEQIKTCIAIQNSNVKIAGAHAGVSVGPDGATHQMIEDVALMRVMPNMKVIVPADSIETKKSTILAAKLKGPCYLRFAREKSPVFTTEKTPFKLGKSEIYRYGYDLTIVASGPILYEALLAANKLSKEFGIEARVINSHSIKPFDAKTLIAAAKETGAIVTAEEAQVAGGLAGVVAETLSLTTPVPIERIGIQDRYGESGTPREVQESMGLTSPFIIMAAQRVLKRKLGQRVTVIPEHISSTDSLRIKMRKTIIEKSLKQAPKKWKGTK